MLPTVRCLRVVGRLLHYDALEIDDFVLPVAGTYTIRVFEGGNDATGNFTIGVSDQPIRLPTPLPAFNTTISGAIDTRSVTWMTTRSQGVPARSSRSSDSPAILI